MAKKRIPLPNVKGDAKENAVSLIADGRIYSGWKSLSITRGVQNLAGGFRLDAIDQWAEKQEPWRLKDQQKVEVVIGKDLVINGFVEVVGPSISKNSKKISIAGRSRSCDLIDCSIEKSGEYKNLTMLQLLQGFCDPFGLIAYDRVGDLKPFKTFSVNPGETYFEAIQRAARLRGVLVNETPVGNIEITRPSGLRSNTEIVEGVNMLTGSASYNSSNRFSKYTVKGQGESNDNLFGSAATEPAAVATDVGVTRFRPMTIVTDSSIDSEKAQERVNWENTTRIAKAATFSVSVVGWRQQNGKLWDIGHEARLRSPFLGVNADLLISDVEYLLTLESKRICNLKLVRKDAFVPIKKAKDESTSNFSDIFNYKEKGSTNE